MRADILLCVALGGCLSPSRILCGHTKKKKNHRNAPRVSSPIWQQGDHKTAYFKGITPEKMVIAKSLEWRTLQW